MTTGEGDPPPDTPGSEPSTTGQVERRAPSLEDSYRQYQLLLSGVQGVRVALWIVSTWVPLQVIEKMAGDIAGKETEFNASVEVSIAVSILLSIGWSISVVKSHGRKRKVKSARAHADRLEREVIELKAEVRVARAELKAAEASAAETKAAGAKGKGGKR